MAQAIKFQQPMDYFGQYKTGSWAGYYFREPLGYTSGVHTGVDYNGPGSGNADLGMSVRSVANGIVRYVGDRSDIGFGKCTIVEYPLSAPLRKELDCNSLFGRFMHQQRIDVSVGQEVLIGQGIGTVGNTGTTWAHLHLDLYKDTISYGGVHFNYDKDSRLESYVDPFEFIQGHQTANTEVLMPFQRIVGVNGVNHRRAPSTTAQVSTEWPADEVLDLAGWIHGESVGGNDIWFTGKYSGGYLWSGAFTDPSTHDLIDLNPAAPTPVPTPTPENFPADSPLVTKVIPSPNFINADQEQKFIVVHQWGRPEDKFTLQGVLNGWQDTVRGVAPHYTIDDSGIYQDVQESKRAQHAGPQGNDGIGIEFDPNGGDAMYALGRALVADIRARRGNLALRMHSEFMPTECPKYINLSRLEPLPNTTPVPPIPPTPAPDIKKLLALFITAGVALIAAIVAWINT